MYVLWGFEFEKAFGLGDWWGLSWLDNLLKFQFSANRAIVRVACLNPKFGDFGRIVYVL